ncbi:MAG: hypothetical protein ACI9MC_000804 [Kiritimatiellia bacterium]|jgi:hypothetical protein
MSRPNMGRQQMKFHSRAGAGAAILGTIVLLSTSCNTPYFRAVSINPISGWADACNAVQIGGSGFGDDVAVTIDGEPLMNLTTPSEADEPHNVGYQIFGTIPPKDLTGDSEYAVFVVSSGGEDSTPFDDFRRRACPGAINPEDIGPDEALAAGAEITVSGCHVKAEYTVTIGGESAAMTNASACEGGTDTATFSAPTLADGAWYLAFQAADGAEIYPAFDNGCDMTVPVGESVGVIGQDDDGNDIMGDLCDGAPIMTYGGGE